MSQTFSFKKLGYKFLCYDVCTDVAGSRLT